MLKPKINNDKKNSPSSSTTQVESFLSAQPKKDPTEEVKEFDSVTIHYFPASIMSFGHISIELFNAKGSKYLSYGCVATGKEGLVGNDTIPSQREDEEKEYGKPISYQLPPIAAKHLLRLAKENFDKLDRKQYHKLLNNCATAVIKFLKDAKYISEEDVISSIPSSVAAVVEKICGMQKTDERAFLIEFLRAIKSAAIVQDYEAVMESAIKISDLQLKIQELGDIDKMPQDKIASLFALIKTALSTRKNQSNIPELSKYFYQIWSIAANDTRRLLQQSDAWHTQLKSIEYDLGIGSIKIKSFK